jgi:hypothetical protein
MQPAPDAIGEFKVVTNMSASARRRRHDQCELPQRNQRAPRHRLEFLRDDSLNATGFFRRRPASPRSTEPVRRRVRRPDHQEQAFYFADYEGQR